MRMRFSIFEYSVHDTHTAPLILFGLHGIAPLK